MHIVENLALNCGCKISRPKIQQVFVPVEYPRYITIDNGEFKDEKSYDLFNCVFKLIKPLLQKEGIKILQVSKHKEQQAVYGIDKDLSSVSYRQKSYLIYHSMLHICVDSFSAQVAGMYDKKTVFVPSILYSGNSKPFFNSYKNLKVVSAETDIKPSLGAPEGIKRVNQRHASKKGCC